jgi:hypothetical protein
MQSWTSRWVPVFCLQACGVVYGLSLHGQAPQASPIGRSWGGGVRPRLLRPCSLEPTTSGAEVERAGALPAQVTAPPPQKIMHTRKRHQDMFQDLNRKLQHAAEKDKEALGPDSKVWRAGGLHGAPGQVPSPHYPKLFLPHPLLIHSLGLPPKTGLVGPRVGPGGAGTGVVRARMGGL